MRWLELSVETMLAETETVAELFRHCCFGGAAIEEAISSGEDEEVLFLGTATIKGYLPVDRALGSRKARLNRGLKRLGVAPTRVEERRLAEEDWASSWKAFFHPIPVGKGLLVTPPWEPAEHSGRVTILLDPGMAFGTGDHPTTQMCLEELEHRLRPGMTVIDLGTGSGVLAIAAAKLGAGRVLALDRDPVAVTAAQENVARNGVKERVYVTLGSLGRAIGPDYLPADLLLANLSSRTLKELAAELAAALKPGGLLIASGVSALQAASVEEALIRAGFSLLDVRQQGEWRALVTVTDPSPR